MTARRLVVLGRQGAGKGTQCVRLAADLAVPHVSTGDVLRAAVRQRTNLGLEAKRFIDAGDLVPDEVIVGVVREKLAEPVARNGWLLDGFPRTLPQAEALLDVLGDDGLDVAIDIDVPNDVVVARLSSRRVCESCGWVTSAPDALSVDCAECGGIASRRSDDTPEAIARRLAHYDEEVGPLQAWFADRGLLARVDGNLSPDEVYATIRRLVQGDSVVSGAA